MGWATIAVGNRRTHFNGFGRGPGRLDLATDDSRE